MEGRARKLQFFQKEAFTTETTQEIFPNFPKFFQNFQSICSLEHLQMISSDTFSQNFNKIIKNIQSIEKDDGIKAV